MLDETHTLICAPGGLTELYGLTPTSSWSARPSAAGCRSATYGMTAELNESFERGESLAGETGELATGGTMFANALSMAAARAVLTDVLTPEAYARAAALGADLADGLEAAVDAAGLPWKMQRLGPRSGVNLSGRLPRDAAEADADEQPELNALLRLYLANRGVWEAISTAGPAMSVAATRDDVETYLAAFRSSSATSPGTTEGADSRGPAPRGTPARGGTYDTVRRDGLYRDLRGVGGRRTRGPRTSARAACSAAPARRPAA